MRAALNLSLPPAAQPLLLPSSSTRRGHGHSGGRRRRRDGDPLIEIFISLAKTVVGGITTAATVVFEGLAGFGGLVREFTINVQKVLKELSKDLNGGENVCDRQGDDGNANDEEEMQQAWYDALIGVTMAVFAVIVLRRAGVRLATAAV